MLLSDFSCYNPPWLCLQKTLAHLFNKLGSACMTHPPDLFDLTASVTPMLPKAAFSFPAAQLPTAMLLCLVKIKGRVQGAQFWSKCLLQASRELPRAVSFERVCLQQEQTFFLSLFEEERWGERKDICIYWERHKSHYHLYVIQIIPYSMEVTTAPLSSGSKYV